MKGLYLLVISVKKDVILNIGKLGRMNFKKGHYVYIGSAQNGITQRVERHLRRIKKKHWHIDYLLDNKNVKVESVFYRETNKKSDECKTAKMFMRNSEAVDGFGCSDCRCRSHLIVLKRK